MIRIAGQPATFHDAVTLLTERHWWLPDEASAAVASALLPLNVEAREELLDYSIEFELEEGIPE